MCGVVVCGSVCDVWCGGVEWSVSRNCMTTFSSFCKWWRGRGGEGEWRGRGFL